MKQVNMQVCDLDCEYYNYVVSTDRIDFKVSEYVLEETYYKILNRTTNAWYFAGPELEITRLIHLD